MVEGVHARQNEERQKRPNCVFETFDFVNIDEAIVTRNTRFVTRTADPELRAQLAARVADFAMTKGLVGRSLSDIADAVESTPRMLVYHFGSKDRLVELALLTVERRLMERFDAQLEIHATVSGAVRAMWELLTSRAFAPVARVALEAFGFALNHPQDFRSYLDQSTELWVAHLTAALGREGLRATRARVVAVLVVGAVHGLLMLRLSNHPHAETEQAFDALMRCLAAELK